MKNIVLVLLFVIFGRYGYSQDKLVLKNNEVIDCKVINVGIDIISYKRADNPNGPVYDIKKKDVSSILYENGVADVFENEKQRQNIGVEKDSLKSATKSHKFHFGLTAGYNASTILHDDEYKIGSGFNVGLIGLFHFVERNVGYLFVEPSILYSRECEKIDLSNLVYDDSYVGEGNPVIIESTKDRNNIYKNYLNHLKIPVQLGYEFKVGKIVTLGPKFGLEYDHYFGNTYDVNYLNLVEGLNMSFKRKFRVWLGWQSNLKFWNENFCDKNDYVNFNANIAYLFF